ncbi:MAG: O-antigen ligase family protein [Candidatus Riflebacteria bacterium]|nr:O-antigen ligase family protein [Candidatus Riflebacteria bacterium]
MLASYISGFSAAWFFPGSFHVALFFLPLALAFSFFICGAGGFSDSYFVGCRLILFSGNPNKLSYLAGIGVLIAIFASRRMKGGYRNFAIFAGGVNMLILILTSSRAALGAIFLSILFVGLVFLRRHFLKILCGLLISGLAVFLFLPSSERDRFGCAISEPSKDETLKRRIAIWDVAFAGIQKRPVIGNSLRGFRKFYADYTTANFASLSLKYGEFKEDPSHPHNLVLGLLYMYGLIGLPLFFLAFIPALRSAFVQNNFLFIAILLFVFLNGMFDFNLHRVSGALMMFFPLGLEYGALAQKCLKPDKAAG